MSRSQMSMVDSLLMSSAVKEQAKNLVCKVPSYAAVNSFPSNVDSQVSKKSAGEMAS